MNNPLVTITLISVGVGVSLAIILLILVQLRRLNKQVNSLVDHNYLIGLMGTVQIPFDKNSKGKIRVNARGNLIDLVAVTESDYQFKLGEPVVILQFQDNKVSVIPEKYLRDDH